MNDQTIRRYLRQGQLRGYRMGNRWLIMDVDVLHFLENGGATRKPRGAAQAGRINTDPSD